MELLKSISRSAENMLRAATSKSDGPQHTVIVTESDSTQKIIEFLNKKLNFTTQLPVEDVALQELSDGQRRIWILRGNFVDTQETEEHDQIFQRNAYGRLRDLCGSWWRQKKLKGVVHCYFLGVSESGVMGVLVGLGLANYHFLDICRGRKSEVYWKFTQKDRALSENIVRRAEAMFTGMNLARHLTNMPADEANPDNICRELSRLFRTHKKVKAEVYDVAKLKKEKCHLLLGVGQGSRTGARLLRLRYQGAPKNKKYFAFVGKGVTFDTGGLDLKNSAGMRLMKKDMAGAATMAGLCHFVSRMGLNINCEFYLPLAENSVSANSTRPGDVHQARSGLWVEIDNTDAEGRLVMADAIDMAVHNNQKTKPEILFDVSTLTGAMRVAVGLDIAGFFSNSDQLASRIEAAATSAGEPVWRMPLFHKYNKMLSSSFADCKNSSDSGFAGAITAALFLQKFVQKTPWVHFDVMSWNNSGDGALGEGANAQTFQTLAQFLLNRSK